MKADNNAALRAEEAQPQSPPAAKRAITIMVSIGLLVLGGGLFGLALSQVPKKELAPLPRQRTGAAPAATLEQEAGPDAAPAGEDAAVQTPPTAASDALPAPGVVSVAEPRYDDAAQK